MEGRNFLEVNPETLSAAMTEYLNRRQVGPGVKARFTSTMAGPSFRFSVEPQQQEKK